MAGVVGDEDPDEVVVEFPKIGLVIRTVERTVDCCGVLVTKTTDGLNEDDEDDDGEVDEVEAMEEVFE
jgi:hypothetical protein